MCERARVLCRFSHGGPVDCFRHVMPSSSSSSALHPRAAFAAGFLSVWLAVLAHAGAHLLAAALLYSPDELANPPLPALEQLVTVGAGPMVTLLIVGVCAAAARKGVSPPVAVWLAAGALGAAARIVLVGWDTLRGTALNDERTLGVLLGVPAQLIWAVELVFVAAAMIRVVGAVPPAVLGRVAAPVLLGAALGAATTLFATRWFGLAL